MRALAAVAGPGLVLLGACTDPEATACANANRDVTLANLAGNTLSGSYERCLSDLRAELVGLQLEARGLDVEATRLDAQAASLGGERRAAAQRLARLHAEQAELMRRIGEEGRSTAADDARVNRIIREERRLRSEITGRRGSGGVDDVTADRILRRQQALNDLARQTL